MESTEVSIEPSSPTGHGTADGPVTFEFRPDPDAADDFRDALVDPFSGSESQTEHDDDDDDNDNDGQTEGQAPSGDDFPRSRPVNNPPRSRASAVFTDTLSSGPEIPRVPPPVNPFEVRRARGPDQGFPGTLSSGPEIPRVRPPVNPFEVRRARGPDQGFPVTLSSGPEIPRVPPPVNPFQVPPLGREQRVAPGSPESSPPPSPPTLFAGAGTRDRPVHLVDLLLGAPTAGERRIIDEDRRGTLEQNRFFDDSAIARFMRDSGISAGHPPVYFFEQPIQEAKRAELLRVARQPANAEDLYPDDDLDGPLPPQVSVRGLQRLKFLEDPIKRLDAEHAGDVGFSDERGLWLYASQALIFLQNIMPSASERRLPDLVLSREKGIVTAFASITGLMHKKQATILEENYRAFDKDSGRVLQAAAEFVKQMAIFEWDDDLGDYVRKPADWQIMAQRARRQGQGPSVGIGSAGLMLRRKRRRPQQGRHWSEDPRARQLVPREMLEEDLLT